MRTFLALYFENVSWNCICYLIIVFILLYSVISAVVIAVILALLPCNFEVVIRQMKKKKQQQHRCVPMRMMLAVYGKSMWKLLLDPAPRTDTHTQENTESQLARKQKNIQKWFWLKGLAPGTTRNIHCLSSMVFLFHSAVIVTESNRMENMWHFATSPSRHLCYTNLKFDHRHTLSTGRKYFFVVVLFRLLNLSLLFAVFRIHSLLSMYWSHDNCMIQPSIKWLYVFREEIKKRNPTFQSNMHIVFCWSRLKFTIKCYANIWQTKELLLLPNRELYQTYLNPNEWSSSIYYNFGVHWLTGFQLSLGIPHNFRPKIHTLFDGNVVLAPTRATLSAHPLSVSQKRESETKVRINFPHRQTLENMFVWLCEFLS